MLIILISVTLYIYISMKNMCFLIICQIMVTISLGTIINKSQQYDETPQIGNQSKCAEERRFAAISYSSSYSGGCVYLLLCVGETRH